MGRRSLGGRTRSISWLRRSAALAMLLVVAVGGAIPHGAAARVIRQPVIIVHGHSPTGRVDCDRFDALVRQLRSADRGQTAYRFAGEVVPVAFYGGDTRAARDDWGDTDRRWWAHLSNHGDHARGMPSGHHRVRGVNGHTVGTSIRHLAYHLAWFIHDRYSGTASRWMSWGSPWADSSSATPSPRPTPASAASHAGCSSMTS